MSAPVATHAQIGELRWLVTQLEAETFSEAVHRVATDDHLDLGYYPSRRGWHSARLDALLDGMAMAAVRAELYP